MKTRTTFELSNEQVTIKLFDVTGLEKGYKLAEMEPLDTLVIELTDEFSQVMDADSENPKSLLAYGLSQFMQDRTASLTDKLFNESGMSAKEAVAEKVGAFNELVDMLKGGRMTKERASGGATKKANVDIFFAKAFVELVKSSKGQELTEEQAIIILQTKMDNEQRKAIRASLQSRINELRSEATKAAQDFDIDSLF
jgi:hypothetical protein